MRLTEFGPDWIPLQEPTYTAPVPTTRIVTCVECDDPVPLRTADVVGLGFRCAPCSLRADVGELSGVPDVAAHLTTDDRARFAERGRRLAGWGIAVAVLIAAYVVVGYAVEPEAWDHWLTDLLGALGLGLALGGVGLARWRRFRVD